MWSWKCLERGESNIWSRGLAGLLSNEHPLLLPCVCLSEPWGVCPANHTSLLHHPACQGKILRALTALLEIQAWGAFRSSPDERC